MKKIIMLILIMMAVIIFYAIISPYIAIYKINQLAHKNDLAHFNEYVDYALLRENFKTTILEKNSHVLLSEEKQKSINFIINNFVESTLTPSNLMSIINNSSEQMDNLYSNPSEKNTSTLSNNISIKGRYSGIDRFYIDIIDNSHINKKAHIEMNRYSLFHWKIISLSF